MILDGFNEWTVIDGIHVCYRPWTRWERPQLQQLIRELPDPLADRLLERTVISRVIEWDCDDINSLPQSTQAKLVELTWGVNLDEQERADEQNLHACAVLHFTYPHLLTVSCNQCRYWLYNPLANTMARQSAGGPPLRRQGTTLCEGGGCPKGHWREPLEPTERVRQAIRWCATWQGPAPADPIAQRNMRIFRDAEREANHRTGDAGVRTGSRAAQPDSHVPTGRTGRARRTAAI